MSRPPPASRVRRHGGRVAAPSAAQPQEVAAAPTESERVATYRSLAALRQAPGAGVAVNKDADRVQSPLAATTLVPTALSASLTHLNNAQGTGADARAVPRSEDKLFALPSATVTPLKPPMRDQLPHPRLGDNAAAGALLERSNEAQAPDVRDELPSAPPQPAEAVSAPPPPETAVMAAHRDARAREYATALAAAARVDVHSSTESTFVCKLRDGHTAAIHALDFADEEGSLLASAGADARICIWDVPRVRVKCTLYVPAAVATCVQWDRSTEIGSVLLSGHMDGSLRIWDMSKQAPARVLHDQSSAIRSVALCDDGSMLAAAGDDGGIVVYNMARVCSPEYGGRVGATASDTILVLIRARAAGNVHGHRGRVNKLQWAPDNQRLVSAGDDGCTSVWQITAGGTHVASFTEHAARVVDVCWDTRGKRVATAADNGNVRIWDGDTGMNTHTLVYQPPPPLDADSKLQTSAEQVSMGLAPATQVAFSAEGGGRRVIAGFANGCVCVYDSETGLCMQTLEDVHTASATSAGTQAASGARGICALAARADGQVFVTAGADAAAAVWVVRAPPCMGSVSWWFTRTHAWLVLSLRYARQRAATRSARVADESVEIDAAGSDGVELNATGQQAQ